MTAAQTVLVVDDDDDLRETIADALSLAGYTTASVRDGAEALATLRAGQRPDLMLLDLMMPGMTGWEVYETVRATPSLRELPVLIMTAMRGSDQPPGMREVDTIRKPFALDSLLARIAAKIDGAAARPPG